MLLEDDTPKFSKYSSLENESTNMESFESTLRYINIERNNKFSLVSHILSVTHANDCSLED